MIPSGIQESVAGEVNDRLTKATRELQDKYARGEGGQDVSVDGPSGTAYKEKHAQELKMKKEKQKARNENNTENNNSKSRAGEDEDGDEDDEDDYALRELRASRLKQLKQEQNQKLDNLSKGHGQYREISQDEFLKEVTSSSYVICHFYHNDFQLCEIMSHHLSILAAKHIESKFLKINAEKAPFFIDKLKIRTIPTVVIFLDGVAVDKIIGFEGLSEGLPEGHEDEWKTNTLAKLLASKKAIDGKTISVLEEEEKTQQMAVSKLETMRAAMLMNDDGLDDLDLEDEDDV